MTIMLTGYLGGPIYTPGNTIFASYLRPRNLNPNDAELLAEMGSLLIFVGQSKQAIDQVKEAIRLNPNHEPWYIQAVPRQSISDRHSQRA